MAEIGGGGGDKVSRQERKASLEGVGGGGDRNPSPTASSSHPPPISTACDSLPLLAAFFPSWGKRESERDIHSSRARAKRRGRERGERDVFANCRDIKHSYLKGATSLGRRKDSWSPTEKKEVGAKQNN